jgi:hypothetical protein
MREEAFSRATATVQSVYGPPRPVESADGGRVLCHNSIDHSEGALTSRVHQDGGSLALRHGGRRRGRHSCLTLARHDGVTMAWRAGEVPETLAPTVITLRVRSAASSSALR